MSNAHSTAWESLYCQAVAELESQRNLEGAFQAARYHKVEGFACYGLTVPELRQTFRGFRTIFKELPMDQRLVLAERFIQAGVEEQAFFMVELLAMSVRQLGPQHFDMLDRFLEDFHSWSTTDLFCGRVLQPLLLAYPVQTVEMLKRWNSAPNLWKRRASVVAFTRKVGSSGNFTKICLEMCENLIWDEEDLVRKGVGWALKDSLRGDKPCVLNYVRELRRRGVSAVITLYALRDLEQGERKSILAIKPERKDQ